MIVKDRKEKILSRFDKLPEIIHRLEIARIPYLIGGSACLYLLGNDREPDDLDIFLRTEDHNRVDEIFKIKSFTYKSNLEEVRNSNPWNEHKYQFTSGLKISTSGEIYNFSLDESIYANQLIITFSQFSLSLLPPEEVLLIKAVLQRGEEVGKHDVADIQNFQKYYQLNNDYLATRINKLHLQSRISNIFKLSKI